MLTTAVLIGLLAGSVALNVAFWRADRAVTKAIAAHQDDFSISLIECKELLVDLNSASSVRLQKWTDRFQQYVDQQTNPAHNLDELYARYQAVEAPGHSNRFAELLLNLSVAERDHVAKSRLVKYLGPPDESEIEKDREVLCYHYTENGSKRSAFVILSNGIAISFMLDAHKEPK